MTELPGRFALEHPVARRDLNPVAVGREGLLFEPTTARVHRLNAAAFLVWQCCDGMATAEEIAGELAVIVGRPESELIGDVSSAMMTFAAAGLFEGTAPPPENDRPAVAPASERPPPVTEPIRRLGPYRALDLRVVIECHDSHAVADELERVMRPLATHHDPAPAGVETFVVWNDDGWHVGAAGNHFQPADESVIADFVMWQINWLAFEHSPRYLVVHASAVARDGRAVVLPATANSGKSTLATALVAAGFDYLTDEATAIDLDTGQVVAYPKPLTLDPGTQQLFPDLDPGRPPGKSSKWYVVPDAVRPGCVVERAELAHLVFPTFMPGADNQLVAVETIDAAEALLSHTFNLAEHGERLADIVALVERCTRHSLRHDGIAGPVAAIRSLA